MSKTWILKFASYQKPDDIFNAVVDGSKSIETRPATKNFKTGDKLILFSVASKRKVKKEIIFIHKYKNPLEMLENEDYNKIFPNIGSKENLLKFYERAKTKWGKKYKGDLKKYGIVAMGIK